jgi:protoheme ferro-lyase
MLVQAVAHNIKAALAKIPESRRSEVVLLFSAHSLPLEIVKYVLIANIYLTHLADAAV